jgi:ABC-type glycerol-3-phosphate transport system substrate-binding protein
MCARKLSRRELLRLGTMTGAGVLLAACAPPAAPQPPAAVEPTKPPEAATAPAPPAAEEASMVYWTWAESNFPHFQQQAERWNKEMTGKPKIKFEGILVPSTDETIQKGMNAMAAGTGLPDIFLIEISQVSKFLKGEPPLGEQYLVDIKPSLQAYNGNWEKDYLGFAPYTWQGRVYGFEIGLCPTAYYYRQDLFDEVGIKMPLATWEDWMAAGEEMKRAKHAMCAFDTTSLNEFIMEFYQAGGALFDQEGNLKVEDERAYKALDLIIGAVKSGVRWPTEAYWGPPHYAALNDGTVAGVISAIWYSPHVLKANAQDTAGKWRVQPMPAWQTSGTWGGPDYDTRQTSTWGGTALTIPKQSTHPELTFDYLAFSLLTKEGATSVYEVMGQMPVVKAVIHDDTVTNIPDEFYGGQAINKVFADLADFIPPKYPNPYWNEAEQELNKTIAPAMAGEDTSENLIHNAADEIRNIMATT